MATPALYISKEEARVARGSPAALAWRATESHARHLEMVSNTGLRKRMHHGDTAVTNPLGEVEGAPTTCCSTDLRGTMCPLSSSGTTVVGRLTPLWLDWRSAPQGGFYV